MELKVEKIKDFTRYFSWGSNQASYYIIIYNQFNNILYVIAYTGVIGLKFVFYAS